MALPVPLKNWLYESNGVPSINVVAGLNSDQWTDCRDLLLKLKNILKGFASVGWQHVYLRGWWAAGSTYEYWSGPAPTTPPPTGHALQFITFGGKLP